MDLDDMFRKKPSGDTVVGADLSPLSVPDLEERVSILRQEIASKQSFRSAAEQAFNS